MTTIPKLRVLFFDVFGTCVAQRPSVANELWGAAKAALESGANTINDDVRAKAIEMSYNHWFEFGGEWNTVGDKFVRESIAQHNSVDWKAVDQHRIELLHTLLAERGLIISTTAADNSKRRVEEGSLWDETQLEHLGRVWHRLPPWPDTCPGLTLLNRQYSTVTLSNTYNDLMRKLVAHSSIPFQHVYTSDLFHSYKPNPAVYLGAAEKMGVKPEECALVAAHLFDLKAAKACGFYAIYVDRPLEEKAPALRGENIPDLVIQQEENGFVSLAERLGIRND